MSCVLCKGECDPSDVCVTCRAELVRAPLALRQNIARAIGRATPIDAIEARRARAAELRERATALEAEAAAVEAAAREEAAVLVTGQE